jgi:type I restriction enzyme S subunit
MNKQSLLAKAFRGELIEQDPNDPPANELLESIKREWVEMSAYATKKKISWRAGEPTIVPKKIKK